MIFNKKESETEAQKFSNALKECLKIVKDTAILLTVNNIPIRVQGIESFTTTEKDKCFFLIFAGEKQYNMEEIVKNIKPAIQKNGGLLE